MLGLNKVISLRASMNKGLSFELLEAFPDIQPVQLPVVRNQKITDPEWIAGFTSGEGTFFVEVRKRSDRPGYQIQLIFKVSQDVRDELLMASLIEYFNCGNIYKDKDGIVSYRVQRFSDIENKIMPFFSKHLIGGVKYLDYLDWCKAVELVKNKDHQTEGGLDQLRLIKVGMNRGRYDS
uniref:LAGLIDADG endonuclease n=1 Tax=Juglanconis juglandina TaxID=1940567 RepID=A0A291LJ05_9PEZI|nr:LAGLIDADG endonuclease [Juglanconis juglandina]